MAEPATIVAWVIPVEVEKLGAHLQAYQSLIETSTTLQLCHRFGQGPLNKIPVELVHQIMDELVFDQRDQLLDKWKARHLLSTRHQSTKTLDLLKSAVALKGNTDDFEEAVYDFSQERCCGCADVKEARAEELCIKYGIEEGYAPEDIDDMCEPCLSLEDYQDNAAFSRHNQPLDLLLHFSSYVCWMQARADLEKEWAVMVADQSLFNTEECLLLEKHFGLTIWVHSAVSGGRHGPTTALLLAQGFKEGRLQKINGLENDAKLPNMGDLSLESLPALTAGRQQAFRRALKKLDLQPCIEPIRKTIDLQSWCFGSGSLSTNRVGTTNKHSKIDATLHGTQMGGSEIDTGLHSMSTEEANGWPKLVSLSSDGITWYE